MVEHPKLGWPVPGNGYAIILNNVVVGALEMNPGYKPFWEAALNLPANSVPWTIDLFVDPGRRGQGIGRAAVREAARLAFDAGATDVVVDIRADNQASIRCFESAGFQKVKFHATHDEGDGEPGPYWFLRLSGRQAASAG
jgi:RimJ/RimL family protein N-acetyltransferase